MVQRFNGETLLSTLHQKNYRNNAYQKTNQIKLKCHPLQKKMNQNNSYSPFTRNLFSLILIFWRQMKYSTFVGINVYKHVLSLRAEYLIFRNVFLNNSLYHNSINFKKSSKKISIFHLFSYLVCELVVVVESFLVIVFLFSFIIGVLFSSDKSLPKVVLGTSKSKFSDRSAFGNKKI